jgi:muramoyltetrapeptide carboxypeptidase
MIQPPKLKAGDTVYLLNISRKGVMEMDFISQTLESWGLQTRIGATITDIGCCQFAASEEVRLLDMQMALDAAEIKAIFFCRGGYGAVQILDKLDFSAFLKQPKWLIGFSDITYLHAHINRNFGIETLHAAMLFGWHTAGKADLESLREALFGTNNTLAFGNLENHKISEVEGELIGGNLSILHTVIGTVSDIDTEGKILVVEDVFENLTSIERMLYALKRSGKFEKIKAVLFGDFSIPIKNNEKSNNMVSEIPVPDENTIEAAFRLMVLHFFKEYDFPLCFGLPVGHVAGRNVALVFGSKVKLEMGHGDLKLNYVKC